MTTKALVAMNGVRLTQADHLRRQFRMIPLASILCLLPFGGRADQVVLQNGDCYYGQVLSLTTNALLFQSDVLGKVTLPRGRVTHIVLGARAPTGSTLQGPGADSASRRSMPFVTNSDPDLEVVLRQLGAQTNLIQQVQAEHLSAAGPEAGKKFQQLVGGLMSGRLTATDIRVEAKSAADQLRAFKQDMGPEVGDALDGYLAILDNFLQEPAPNTSAARSPATAPPKPQSGALRKAE